MALTGAFFRRKWQSSMCMWCEKKWKKQKEKHESLKAKRPTKGIVLFTEETFAAHTAGIRALVQPQPHPFALVRLLGMHPDARDFTLKVKGHFASHFTGGKRVLDVGSGDVNGNNHHLFDASCTYEGIDVAPGPNVDHVCAAGDFKIHEPGPHYDTIVSTECFEHDMDFVRSLRNIVRLVKPGGLFLFTCASTDRPEHGTARCDPSASLSTKIDVHSAKWYPNYYRNLTPDDVQRAVPIHLYFDSFAFEANRTAKDMYFWGVRNAKPYGPEENTPEKRSLVAMEATFARFPTDKGPSFHRYTRQYHALFDRFRYATGVRYLEIGVFDGDSLRAMRAHLPNATHVVGVDINPRCKVNESPVDHVFVEIGSATDKAFLESVVAKYGPFDIIVDDGSHIAEHIISAFETLYPLLKDDGLYIVEDTVCVCKPEAFKQNKEGPDHISYFHRYLPMLNQWNWSNPTYSGPYGNCVDPDKIVKRTTDPFEASIDSVQFGVSFVAITKRMRRNWLVPTAHIPLSVQF